MAVVLEGSLLAEIKRTLTGTWGKPCQRDFLQEPMSYSEGGVIESAGASFFFKVSTRSTRGGLQEG